MATKECNYTFDPMFIATITLRRRVYMDLFHAYIKGKYETGGFKGFLEDVAEYIWDMRGKVSMGSRKFRLQDLLQPELFVRFPRGKPLSEPGPREKPMRAKKDAPLEEDPTMETYAFPRQWDLIQARLTDRKSRILEDDDCHRMILADWFTQRESTCDADKPHCLERTSDLWQKQMLGNLPVESPYTLENLKHLLYKAIFVRGIDVETRKSVYVTFPVTEEDPTAMQEFMQTVAPTPDPLYRLFTDPTHPRVFLLWCLYRDFVFHSIDMFRVRVLRNAERIKAHPDIFSDAAQTRHWYAPLLRVIMSGEPMPDTVGLRNTETILDHWKKDDLVDRKWYQAWRKQRETLYPAVWKDLQTLTQVLLSSNVMEIESLYAQFRQARKDDTLSFAAIRQDIQNELTQEQQEVVGFGTLLMEPFPWSAQPRSRIQRGGSMREKYMSIIKRINEHMARHMVRVGIRQNAILASLQYIPKNMYEDLIVRYPEVVNAISQQSAARIVLRLKEETSAMPEDAAKSEFINFIQRYIIKFMISPEEKKKDPLASSRKQDLLWEYTRETVLQKWVLHKDHDLVRRVFVLPDNPHADIEINWQIWNGLVKNETLAPLEMMDAIRKRWQGYILSEEVEDLLTRYFLHARFDARKWMPLACVPVHGEGISNTILTSARSALQSMFHIRVLLHALLLSKIDKRSPIRTVYQRYFQLEHYKEKMNQNRLFVPWEDLQMKNVTEEVKPWEIVEHLVKTSKSETLEREIRVVKGPLIKLDRPYAAVWHILPTATSASSIAKLHYLNGYLYRLRYMLAQTTKDGWFVVDAVDTWSKVGKSKSFTAVDMSVGCAIDADSRKNPSFVCCVYERMGSTVLDRNRTPIPISYIMKAVGKIPYETAHTLMAAALVPATVSHMALTGSTSPDFSHLLLMGAIPPSASHLPATGSPSPPLTSHLLLTTTPPATGIAAPVTSHLYLTTTV